MNYIDLTQTFTNSMPVYPGDPVPKLVRVAEFAKDGYVDHEIKTGMHVGTHLDGPLHMVAGGNYLSEMPVETFFGAGVLVGARGCEVIEMEVLEGKGIKAGDIVLFFTGGAEHFGQADYYHAYPELSEACARRLIELKVKMIGFDAPSPDRAPFVIHKLLLGQGILILENLCNLEKLLGVPEFEIVALPAKFRADSAPVRVVARIG